MKDDSTQHHEPAKVTFESFIMLMSTQALISMGIVPDPTKEDSEPNLPLARHTIDTLAMIRDKTKGNLTRDESAFLEDALHQLRMRYVELARSGTSQAK